MPNLRKSRIKNNSTGQYETGTSIKLQGEGSIYTPDLCSLILLAPRFDWKSCLPNQSVFVMLQFIEAQEQFCEAALFVACQQELL